MRADWDILELSYGLPFYPLSFPGMQETLVLRWGATDGPWGIRIYTDGLGLSNSSPELRRCGWACVDVSPWGLPLRALYRPLPGRQTVPRAERYAGLRAMRVAPQEVGGVHGPPVVRPRRVLLGPLSGLS